MTQSFKHIFPLLITFLLMIMSPLKIDCQDSKKVNDIIRKKPLCTMTLKKVEREKYVQSVISEEAFNQTRMDGTYNIPVQFHLLRMSNGTGGLTAAEAATELAQANIRYAGMGVEFFQCSPVNFIDDDVLWNTVFDHDWDNFCGQTNAEYQIANANNVANVVNLYYVNTDGWNWSSFPSYVEDYCKDWIILDIDDIGTTTLLAHELGHYFNLLHTFQDHNDPDYNEHITRNVGNSCWNCPVTGDLLCDTPADNNSWDNACNWDGTGDDGCSNLSFTPSEENIMSYSDCPEFFTEGQNNRIINCILTSRAYLNCPFLSDCETTWNLSSTQNTMYAYQATNYITSTSDVNSGANSVYDAGNYVKLQPGFHAKAGSTFSAILDGCWAPVIFP